MRVGEKVIEDQGVRVDVGEDFLGLGTHKDCEDFREVATEDFIQVRIGVQER